jgi:hypothetical protein
MKYSNGGFMIAATGVNFWDSMHMFDLIIYHSEFIAVQIFTKPTLMCC